MRFCGDSANRLLTREQGTHEFGRLHVARRQEMRVHAHRRHRRGVAEPRGDDVNGDPAREQVRGVRVADVV